MSIKELSFSGSYYEVGRALGAATKREVHHVLTVFQRSDLYKKLRDQLGSPNVASVVSGFERLTEEHCPDIVSELRGLAEGAGVDYKELLLLNLKPEWVALFSDVPGQSKHGIKYASTFDGCTNIYLPVPLTEKLYFGHTEDVCPDTMDCGYLVHHTIYSNTDKGCTGDPVECFTEYIIPGILAGSKFGFNNSGLMYGHNMVYQQGLNKAGIPRRFAFRALVSLGSVDDAIQKLRSFPGIATAYTFNCLYKKNVNGKEQVVFGGFEVAGDETRGTLIDDVHPTGVYIHCNTFQHLKYPCHPEESSLHRLATIRELLSRGELSSQSDLLKALSNQDDPQYPVHRSGNSPDYLGTGATGIFDSSTFTMTVYRGRPTDCKGTEIRVFRHAQDR